MSIVGKVELTADKDVSAGTETSIFELFSREGGRQVFPVAVDVKRDETKLKITVTKLGTLDAISDATRRKGQYTSLRLLMNKSDFSKKVKASEPVKKGDILTVTVEAT
jgi:hypothetical protein